MNSQVQYLQKQIQRRDAQIQVLLMALDGCEREKELSESVACAFAWDLAAEEEGYTTLSTEVLRLCGVRWDDALESTRGARTATEIAIRNEDERLPTQADDPNEAGK